MFSLLFCVEQIEKLLTISLIIMDNLIVQKTVFTFFSLFYGLCVFLVIAIFHISTRFRYTRSKAYSKRPSLLDDPQWGEHHLIEVNNKNIHCVAKGNPDDPVVVFLHGFPDFWFCWRDQLIEFGSKGYYAVAIDLPGFGESSKILESGQRKVDLVANDLSKVIESLTKSKDKKIMLVGHDWGAIVSFYLAYNYPNLVDKLIIVNGPHPINFRKLLFSSLKQFRASWYMLFIGLPYLPEYAFQLYDYYLLNMTFKKGDGSYIMTESELEPWKYIYSQPGAITSALGYYRDNIKNFDKPDNDLRIKQRMMCIWGEKDLFLRPELATGMVNYVDSLRLRMIKECGHFVPHEDPQSVNTYIGEFLKE